jgi:hypothetical protein
VYVSPKCRDVNACSDHLRCTENPRDFDLESSERDALLGPSIFQSRDFVEYDFAVSMLHAIRDKVPMPRKLKFVVSLCARERGLEVGCDGLQAVGVQGARQVFAAGVGVFGVEEAVM